MNIYGILNRRTIDTSTVVRSGREVDVYTWLIEHGYVRAELADYYGYIEKDWCYLYKYSGRYGDGYVACSHAYDKRGKTSTKVFTLECWVKD